MSKYAQVVTLKIGDEVVPGRIRDFRIKEPKELPEGGEVQASFTFESSFLVRNEEWMPVLRFIGDEQRRRKLANEIRGAEVELFAAVMRYWVFL